MEDLIAADPVRVTPAPVAGTLDPSAGPCLWIRRHAYPDDRRDAGAAPIAIILIVWSGLVSRKALKNARPYVFLGAFVFGMLLSPPDVFSQTLLAVPMYALFEIALLICARFLPDR